MDHDQRFKNLSQELLKEKFGALPLHVVERLHQLPLEELTRLSRALLRAESLRELGLGD